MKLLLLILSFQPLSLRAFAPRMTSNSRMETSLDVQKFGGFVENLLNPLGAAILFTSVVLQPDHAFANDNIMMPFSAGLY